MQNSALFRSAVGLLCALWLATCAFADSPAKPVFFRGLNLNGPAVEIDGHQWQGQDSADYRTSDMAFDNQDVPLRPETDVARALMIRSSRWNHKVDIELTSIPADAYSVYVYIWEDNHSETFTLALQGQDVAVDVRSGDAGQWQRLGPFVVQTDKSQSLRLTTRGGAANISGIELWRGVGEIPTPGKKPLPVPPQITAAQAAHFRTQIAPLLATRCLECHNRSEPRGELDLSQWHKAFAGGETGAAIVPGKPDESLLWSYVDSDEMPKGRAALTADEKQLLLAWIKDGAPWAEATIDPFAYSSARRAGYNWWSFQPIVQPPLPSVKSLPAGGHDLDRFVVAKLASVGLSPAPVADRRTLIRRVTFDLIGLPPTPEEVAAFEQDRDPAAYEKLVDKLLASPHYGERWARHWLDVIRFGETQGYERNRIRDNAWRYRDWVIDALNRNLPYDDFVRDQIAGDVLHPGDVNALIATGYHVIGTWDQVGHNEGSDAMRKSVRQDDLEDLVGTLGQSFLGLSLQCARCHDHKFDPIPQTDYYRFASLLAGVTQKEEEREGLTAKAPLTGLATRDFQGVVHMPAFQQPPTTFVLARGDFRKPGDAIAPAGLSALARNGLPDDFQLSPSAPEAERRRELARWLTDARNPLLARVFVNRVWYYHLGEGLVETPSDFGFNGAKPTHPELLDYLAAGFIAQGFDIKALHKQIVLSHTYRQASRVKSAAAEKVDAENRLLWRAHRKRLEGEAVRDAVLAVSGALNSQLGGPSYRDIKVASNNNNHEFTGPTGEFTSDTCRRSIYRLWARSGTNPLLDGLDCPDPTVSVPRRARTITPLQALSLLNNRLMEQASQRFAERVRAASGDKVDDQIALAYRYALSRDPKAQETTLAREFITEFGLEQFCLTLLNTNEFIFIN